MVCDHKQLPTAREKQRERDGTTDEFYRSFSLRRRGYCVLSYLTTLPRSRTVISQTQRETRRLLGDGFRRGFSHPIMHHSSTRKDRTKIKKQRVQLKGISRNGK